MATDMVCPPGVTRWRKGARRATLSMSGMSRDVTRETAQQRDAVAEPDRARRCRVCELQLERVHFSIVNTRSAARSLPASVLMVHLSLSV